MTWTSQACSGYGLTRTRTLTRCWQSFITTLVCVHLTQRRSMLIFSFSRLLQHDDFTNTSEHENYHSWPTTSKPRLYRTFMVSINHLELLARRTAWSETRCTLRTRWHWEEPNTAEVRERSCQTYCYATTICCHPLYQCTKRHQYILGGLFFHGSLCRQGSAIDQPVRKQL